ncbi:serine/threonine-protein kinase [uncultured Deinococcus sp.]|uniref:serine/threonine-protein kinase n=1 Tax=uncultured Deinococcus sp. TaxID=158789 RepID=UPI003748FF11
MSPATHLEVTQPRLLHRSGGLRCEGASWRRRSVFVKTRESHAPHTVRRFWQEGEIASRLCHPLVVPLLARTPTQLVYPWIEGRTLRDLLQEGPLSPDEATSVAWGVLEALAYLHDEGITHHDLKPENVMLEGGRAEAGAVRLIDFGMSHLQDLPDGAEHLAMGTPHFMAPEQFGGVRGDPRSDLYSVGALLFDCVAGEPPHKDALAWLLGRPQPVPQLPGPAALHTFFGRTLQRDPARRTAEIRELQACLNRARALLNLPQLSLPDVLGQPGDALTSLWD